LFPAKLLDRLDVEQRSALLVHELAHLRRRDHWVRFLEMAVMAVYWWHPVVWWARHQLHEAEEQCCDAWVVWALTSGGRGSRRASRSYALALLHTVDFFSHARPTLPAPASGVGQVPHLRRRLTMIMNGNTSKSLSAAGRLAVLAVGLLLPLVPIQAQQPPSDQDRRDPRDQQIQNLRKAIQALEEQQRAEQAERAADSLHRVKEQEAQAHKAEQKAREQLHVLRLQEAQLAQNPDSEQRKTLRLHLVDEKADGEVQGVMKRIEEMTKLIEVKRQELRSLEERLQHARVDLEKTRADSAQREAKRRIELRGDAEVHREPIIIKIDPSVSPEQIKAQVEALQGKIKQPIRVEIVEPLRPAPFWGHSPGAVRNRVPSPPPDPRPREVEPGRSAREPRPRDSGSSNLEEKLERIMKEVEELRRELRSSRK
jgi:beta-lactamase regulating signal transducer with metallopeptidase domain